MKAYYHGTYDHLPMGLVLTGRGDAYHDEWSVLSHYEALHAHMPEGATPHREAVFMCEEIDDIDLCGGATEVVALLEPIGEVTRHDLNWSGIISGLLEEGRGFDDPDLAEACRKYWSGEPSPGEQVWEVLARGARVIACCDYDDPEAEEVLAAFLRGDGDGPSP